MSEQDGGPPPIGRNTRITLGAVAAAAAAVIGAMGVLDSRAEERAQELREIQWTLREVSSAVSDLRARQAEYVTTERFRGWVEVARARNPSLELPDWR